MSLDGWKQPVPRMAGFLVLGALVLLVALHAGFAGVQVKVGS